MKTTRLNLHQQPDILRKALLGLALSILCMPLALAQGTAFTYQGRLVDAGQPATGLYDIRCQIYDAMQFGMLVADGVTNAAVPVTNGLFVLELDFGAGPFNGSERWLALLVRTNSGSAFTALKPRQRLAPTPYALHAANAASAASAVSVGAGAVGPGGLQINSVNGGHVTDGTLSAVDVNAATFDFTFWKAGGNAGTTPGTHFLGTTDNQPLELKVNNTRVLRLEPNGGCPNFIGGHPDNVVSNGFWGATISGGGGVGTAKNTVGGSYGTIGGGAFNKVIGSYGVVGGGAENVAGSADATIGGGVLNEAGEDATVGGGYQNRANALKAAIGGGQWNYASGNWSFVGGGLDNRASSNYAGVVGGQLNRAQGPWSAVGGGQDNATQPLSDCATIAGGHGNRVWGDHSTIAGGQENLVGSQITASHAAIGGGIGNTVEGGGGGVIGGGADNSLDSESHHSVVGGGQANRIAEAQIFTSHFSGHSTIGGGNDNRALGQFATVGGGATNRAYGAATAAGTVGGGVNNLALFGDTVGGGRDNVANGGGSTVPGGYQNEASGNLSFAAGYQARASHARSFVWSSRDNPAPSFATNRFHVHASEGFSVDYATQAGNGLGTRWVVLGGYMQFAGETISTWTGARLTDGGVWTDNSDRNAKENFKPVDPRDILDRVTALPVQQWNYKTEGPDVSHIGPVAQDFYAAFGTGADDKHLAALDSAGVALAAIQGLNAKVESAKQKAQTRMEQLGAENAALKARLEKLEQLLNQKFNGGKP